MYQTSHIVGVELKYIDGLLSGEPLAQLIRYGQIVKEVAKTKIIKIEYVFSKQSIALSNKNIINDPFDGDKRFFEIFYIDTNGLKKPI
ncbi:hypothetical protein [Xanthocytophaga agilis]|uniref:Uncharacterized protein n=1 Tax=Xanthocytophaga agilis TaxID=3048010 RepID=A0AAE3R1H2_9BACT|nr:hypothetical protein [Xanthocytophaga agilis]MDJ1499909.1 hypothetical protein [Xanthocytophaga agilis]